MEQTLSRPAAVRLERTSIAPGREVAVTALVWLAIAVVAVTLRVVAQMVSGVAVTLSHALADLPLLSLWALATPVILRSARRMPVQPPRAVFHAAAHLAVGCAFVVMTNVLIRLPLLASPDGVRLLLRSTALGLTVYAPTAVICYGVIVAIGHRMLRGAALPAEPRMEAAMPVEPGDESRLVIREWNRVHLIAFDDIEWIEADNNHVVVHTPTRTYKGRERMSDVEGRLDQRRFVRVHRSAIVHRDRIREVQPLMHGDQAVIMKSGNVVRVARGRRQALEDALGMKL